MSLREWDLEERAQTNVLNQWYDEMPDRRDGLIGPPPSAAELSLFESLGSKVAERLSWLKEMNKNGGLERIQLDGHRIANRKQMRLRRAAKPKEPITKKCAQCGERFEAKRSTALFCSTKCRVYYNREQESGGKQSVTKRSAKHRTR